MVVFFAELCFVSFLPFWGLMYIAGSAYLRPCFPSLDRSFLLLFLCFSLPLSVLFFVLSKNRVNRPNALQIALLLNYVVSFVIAVGFLLFGFD